MSATRIYRYVCCEVFFFFDFPNIHRSVLGRITIDLFYFWDVYDVIMGQSIKYLFVFDWLSVDGFLKIFFALVFVIASSSSRLQVYNYCFKIYWDDNLYKSRTWHKHELSGREKNKHKIGLQVCNFLKKTLKHRCFLWNLWNFQEQQRLLLKTCSILLCNKKLCRA